MIKPPPLPVVFTFLTFFVVLGLIAFRLLWSAPFVAKLGLLPKSWQRWILGEPGDKKPN
jgi:hypothetical protein